MIHGKKYLISILFGTQQNGHDIISTVALSFSYNFKLQLENLCSFLPREPMF